MSLNDPSGQGSPFWPKKIRPPNRYGRVGFQQVKLFYFRCVVKRDPPCATLQSSPACCGALAGLHLNDGEYPFSGKPPGLGIIRSRPFADIEVGDADLYKERNLCGCCVRCIDVYTVYIKHTISRIGISALLGVGEDLVCAFLRLAVRPGLADTVKLCGYIRSIS